MGHHLVISHIFHTRPKPQNTDTARPVVFVEIEPGQQFLVISDWFDV